MGSDWVVTLGKEHGERVRAAELRARAAQDGAVRVHERGLRDVLGVVGVAQVAERRVVHDVAVRAMERLEFPVRVVTGLPWRHGK